MQNFPNEKQIGRTWPILLSLRAYLIDVKTNRFACCLRPKPLKIRESRTPWSHTSFESFLTSTPRWTALQISSVLFTFASWSAPFTTIYAVWFYLAALIFYVDRLLDRISMVHGNDRGSQEASLREVPKVPRRPAHGEWAPESLVRQQPYLCKISVVISHAYISSSWDDSDSAPLFQVNLGINPDSELNCWFNIHGD